MLGLLCRNLCRPVLFVSLFLCSCHRAGKKKSSRHVSWQFSFRAVCKTTLDEEQTYTNAHVYSYIIPPHMTVCTATYRDFETNLYFPSSFFCPLRFAKQLSQPNADLSFNHIYYLEKRDVVLPPPPEPILGPHGWVYPPHPPSPAPRITGRTTALRLRTGEFVQHRIGLMKRTQAYAKRSNVPVDNLVTFSVSVGGVPSGTGSRPVLGAPWMGSSV